MKNTEFLSFTKLISFVLIITFINLKNGYAQKGDAAFNKGDKVIGVSLGAGVNFGYATYHGGSYSNIPAIAFTYDQCFFENVGPGNIGIGGIIGFKSAYYKYPLNNGNYKDVYTNYIIGVRGTYHLTLLKDKNNKFDPYAGITLGVRIFKHTNNEPNNPYVYNYNPAYPVTGGFIGAKYNFAQHVGVFGELGYDISFFRIGLNFNF